MTAKSLKPAQNSIEMDDFYDDDEFDEYEEEDEEESENE